MDWSDLPFAECLRGTESEMWAFALDRARRQFAWKTGGLDAEQLRRVHPPSTMTLAGLIKHMAFVDAGFTAAAADRPLGPPWDQRDWGSNDDWSWESAVDDSPAELYALWYSGATHARAAWADLSAHDGLDVLVDDPDPAWTKNRRRILADLLEEYLKHTGHADVLREAVDGIRGNDPD